jgi:hypothetical protein
MIQRVLQIIYDSFYATGGKWPSRVYLERELNRQSDRRLDVVDVVKILQHIPPALLKPVSGAAGDLAPAEKLVLTLEGIARCSRSRDDVENTLAAVKWLARRAEHPDLSDEQDQRGVRFTISQLAEAVALSVDSDQKAISRLISILESEGWI